MANPYTDGGICCSYPIKNILSYAASDFCIDGGPWSNACSWGNYTCSTTEPDYEDGYDGDPLVGDIFYGCEATDDCDLNQNIGGNFLFDVDETLEAWLAIAKNLGYCDEFDCTYMQENYCETRLSDWSVNEGCTDESACNYDILAGVDDGSCYYPELEWCWQDTTVPPDNHYETRVQLGICPGDTCEDMSQLGLYYSSTQGLEGCTDKDFCEYNPDAVIDDGSCETDSEQFMHLCYEDLDGDGDYESQIWLHFCPDQTCEDQDGDYVTPGDNQGFVYGCNDISACNYDLGATENDGSCEYGYYGDGYVTEGYCQDINVLRHFVALNPEYCSEDWLSNDVTNNNPDARCCGEKYFYCDEAITGDPGHQDEQHYTDKAECDAANANNLCYLPTGEYQLGNCRVDWSISCKGWEELTVDVMINNGFASFDDNGHLVKIEMKRKGLHGRIPDEIGYSAKIKVLDFTTNGYQWGGLFGGQIPESIGNLTDLEVFQGMGNSWEGEIPTSITPDVDTASGNMVGGLQKLIKLDLQGILSGAPDEQASRKLTGNIPENIGHLSSLQHLGLQRNELSGVIPDSMGEFERPMSYFQIGTNKLQGVIPNSICDLIANSNFEYISHPYFSNNELCPREMQPRCITDDMFGNQDSDLEMCNTDSVFLSSPILPQKPKIFFEMSQIMKNKNISKKDKIKMVSRKIRKQKRNR